MLAVTGATIYPAVSSPVEGATLLIRDGRISALGRDITPPDNAEIVRADGLHIIPGIIEAHSHLVAHDRSDYEDGPGAKESPLGDNATADLDYYYLFDPHHRHLKDALWGGVTTALIRPGSGKPIDGVGFVTKTAGTSRDRMILKRPDGVKMALGENPKRAFGQRQGKLPATRMATAAVIRQALVAAEDYRRKRKSNPDKTPPEPGLEYLVRMLDGELPARVHAHRGDDIMTAIRLSEEFGFDVTIEHATDAHKIVDAVASRDVPCVVGPSLTSRGKLEVKDRTFATAGILDRAGVKVAITTDAGVVFIGYLRICAALAVRAGMSEEGALRAVTINAAEICGVEDRVGSLEPGKDADFVILDGPPLEMTSKVLATYVDGRRVYDADEFTEEWQDRKNPYIQEEGVI